MIDEFIKALADAEEIWNSSCLKTYDPMDDSTVPVSLKMSILTQIAQGLFLAGYVNVLTESMKQVSADIKKFTDNFQVEVPGVKNETTDKHR